MHTQRYIIVDLADGLGPDDPAQVLQAIRMTRGVRSADWCEGDSATYGAYHRCRRAYDDALRKALADADAFLRGPDGGIILPPRTNRFKTDK